MRPEYKQLLADARKGWRGLGKLNGSYWDHEHRSEVTAVCFLGAVGIARKFETSYDCSAIPELSSSLDFWIELTIASDTSSSKKEALQRIFSILEAVGD
jgi:hypothetical protein